MPPMILSIKNALDILFLLERDLEHFFAIYFKKYYLFPLKFFPL